MDKNISFKQYTSFLAPETTTIPSTTLITTELPSITTITTEQALTRMFTEPPIEGSGETDEPVSKNKCRADDSVQCADGSTSICADQICDGIEDCDDGGDEKECLHGGKNFYSVVLTAITAFVVLGFTEGSNSRFRM